MNNSTPNTMPDPRTIAFESLNTERLGLVLGLESNSQHRPHPVLMAAAGAVLTASAFAGANYLTNQDVDVTQHDVALETVELPVAGSALRLTEDDNMPHRIMTVQPSVAPSPSAKPTPSAVPVIAAPPSPAPVAPKPVPKPTPVVAKLAVKPQPVAPAYPSNSNYGRVINAKITDEMLQTGVSKWIKQQIGDYMDDATLRSSSGMAPNQAFAKNQPIRYRDCLQGKQMTVKAGTSASRIVQELNKYNWPITMEQLVEWNGGKNGLKVIAGYCIRIAK